MPLILLALLTTRCQVPSERTVDLYRGASLFSTSAPNYQDVEDTTLDQSTPDEQHGGDYTLQGGPSHTILIRFGSLAAALGPNVRVKDAKLILSGTSVSAPRLHSIGLVTRPWGEGAFHVQYLPKKVIIDKDGKEQTVAPPKYFGASWKNRFANLPGASWQSPGATSEADAVPIAEAKESTNSNQCEIDGLGPAVQNMLADSGANYGFALTFDSDAEFFSSECAGGKPRLVVTLDAAPTTGGDLAVDLITPDSNGYTARIRNLGNEPVNGVKATWTIGAREGSTLEIPGAIAPGQVKEIHLDSSPRINNGDHRLDAVTLRIAAAPNDHALGDKQLTVYPGGVPIAAMIDHASLAAGEKLVSSRGIGLQNWIQSQLDLVNDVYLARSRYSFAPEGCRERVRLAEVKDFGPPVDGGAPTGVQIVVNLGQGSLPYVDLGFIRRLFLAIGAPDLGITAYPRGSASVKVPGWNVAGLSIAPDITGGGDTRFDGNIPSQILLPQTAVDDPTLADIPFESNGLLSPDAVGILDSMLTNKLSERAAAKVAAATTVPSTIFVDASDANGRPFKNITLDFFQSHAGVVGDQPEFSIQTSDSGAALLPKRTVPGTQITNPFGSRDLDADGAFLVRAVSNGEVAWAWLKAWQLREAALRGDAKFASVPLYFMLPTGAVDRTVNRAIGHVVTDSAGSLPAKLAPLVDGQTHGNVELPTKPGDWVEIDLNRDWTLAELRLITAGEPMWDGFRIQVYQTGQKPESALVWSSEVNWKWSAANRGNTDTAGRTTVAYNGPLVQIRYIRIVCTKPGKGGLAQVEAFSTKVGT